MEDLQDGVHLALGVAEPGLELERKAFENDQALPVLGGDRREAPAGEEPSEHAGLLPRPRPLGEIGVHRGILGKGLGHGAQRFTVEGQVAADQADLDQPAELSPDPALVHREGVGDGGGVDGTLGGGAEDGEAHRVDGDAEIVGRFEHAASVPRGFGRTAGRLPPVARLLLIRHAPTAETGKILTGRLPGVGLHDEGRDVAEALARSLEASPLAAIYTSPVLRCRQTAKAVALPHGLSPSTVGGLAEVDYGEWAGRPLKVLARTKLWESVVRAPSRVRFPGGETLAEVQARAVAACEAISTRHAKDTVAVVSHGDVIKAAVAHFIGTPLDLFQRIRVQPASVSIVDVPPVGPPAVIAVNRLPWGVEG
jgi:probable phosphomutase (TIGR03848 family)